MMESEGDDDESESHFHDISNEHQQKLNLLRESFENFLKIIEN